MTSKLTFHTELGDQTDRGTDWIYDPDENKVRLMPFTTVKGKKNYRPGKTIDLDAAKADKSLAKEGRAKLNELQEKYAAPTRSPHK